MSAPVCPRGFSPAWRSLRPLRLTMVLPLPSGPLTPPRRYLRVPSWAWFPPQSLGPEWLQRLRPRTTPLNCHAPVRVSQIHLSRMPRSPARNSTTPRTLHVYVESTRHFQRLSYVENPDPLHTPTMSRSPCVDCASFEVSGSHDR